MASFTTPAWYRLLRYWMDKCDKHGLSFSFLVGATKDPMGTEFGDEHGAKEYSRALYDEIIKAKVEGFIALIHGCQGIHGPVVTLEYGLRPGFYKNMPSFDELWQFYGKAITSGEFSLTRGRFHAMTEEERTWVAKAID